MEVSDTWCCNKAEWIVEDRRSGRRRRGVAVALQSLYLRRRTDGDYGSSRDRADVIFV